MLLALSAHHVDRHASNFALRIDRYRLPVAARGQGQGRGKSCGLDEYVDPAAAGLALQIAIDIAARFAPRTGDAVALTDHVAAEIEFVAVACAAQALLQAASTAIDFVIGPAANAFGRSVRERNCAAA